MLKITSKDNSRLRHARLVRDGRIDNEIFIEGLRLCEEALDAGLEIMDAFFTSGFAEKQRGKDILLRLADAAEIPEKLLDGISDTKNPQGLVILAKRPQKEFIASTERLILILHKISNPANLGAILRTAEAAGLACVILTKGSADPFSPKTLRGSMGAAFRLKIMEKGSFEEAIAFCKKEGFVSICADIHSESLYDEIDWKGRHALIMGSEANGLTQDERRLCDESLRIPMAEPVESLNIAVACGIILFEARKALLS